RKMRRPEQSASQVVGPAVQRTYDVLRVAPSTQDDGLAVPADIRQQPHFIRPLRRAHEYLRIIAPGQRLKIAGLGHHQGVTNVAWAVCEQRAQFGRVKCGIEVGAYRKLRTRTRG